MAKCSWSPRPATTRSPNARISSAPPSWHFWRHTVPRAGLTEARVVEEAEVLADEGGPVTLVELARRLGVQVPSLYKHVAGADDLQRLVSLRAKNELADLLARATAGKAG